MNKLIVPLRKENVIVIGNKDAAVNYVRRTYKTRSVMYRNRQGVSFQGEQTMDHQFLLVTYQKRRAKDGIPSHWNIDVTFLPMQLMEFMPAGTEIRQRARYADMYTPRVDSDTMTKFGGF